MKVTPPKKGNRQNTPTKQIAAIVKRIRASPNYTEEIGRQLGIVADGTDTGPRPSRSDEADDQDRGFSQEIR